MKDANSFCVVITGNIASGKSHASAFFKNLGYEIIDADKLGHLALEKNSTEVIRAFGNGILQDGIISRSKLGEIVFADREKLRLLESIVHPEIVRCVCESMHRLESQKKIFFLDMPIFFESNGMNLYHYSKILLITASIEVRISRLAKRGLDEQSARNRIIAQMRDEEKIAKSDVVIENNSSFEEFESKLYDFLESLKNR